MLVESAPSAPVQLPAVDEETLEIARVLEQAADRIQTHGWARSTLVRNESSCAVGAIGIVTGNRGHYPSSSKTLYGRAANALAEFLLTNRKVLRTSGPRYNVVTHWNDKQTRRIVVIRTMREAAASLLR